MKAWRDYPMLCSMYAVYFSGITAATIAIDPAASMHTDGAWMLLALCAMAGVLLGILHVYALHRLYRTHLRETYGDEYGERYYRDYIYG